MAEFDLQLKALVAKYKARADEKVGAIVDNIVAELDNRSPVGDAVYWKHPPPPGYVGGHFRANWQLGVDHIPGGVIAGHAYAGTEGANQARIPKDAAGKVYYIVNNVPYARALEDGHSVRQAPAGVVGLTVTKFQAIVARVMTEGRI